MIKIDTSNILFICGGAFVGLERIIENRVAEHAMGFGADVHARSNRDRDTLYRQLHPDDLIRFGLIPEFVGRLPIHVTLHELTKDDLVRIIREPKNSVLKQYQTALKLDDVELVFEDDAITEIAELAISRKTGARGLRAIVENLMIDLMYEIPSIPGSKRVTISPEAVRNETKPEIVPVKKSA
jgi:ATP-dependent Clp protease ATP-binding subunit ClpX